MCHIEVLEMGLFAEKKGFEDLSLTFLNYFLDSLLFSKIHF